MGVSILAVLCAGGSLCKIGAELPHVTLVLPGKLDKHPWGEFAPWGQLGWASGPMGKASPTCSNEPGPPVLRPCGAHVCFLMSRTGVGSDFFLLPVAAASKSPLAAALPT